MKLIDEFVAELEAIDVEPTSRSDFVAFWDHTVALARKTDLDFKSEKINYSIPSIDVFDITFAGLDGTPVKGWVILPDKAKENPVPALVCPPENVYAAFNKINAPKKICPCPFGEHDGGGAYHDEVKLDFVFRNFF